MPADSEHDRAKQAGELTELLPSTSSSRNQAAPILQSIDDDEDSLLEEALEAFAPNAPLANPRELLNYLPNSESTIGHFVLNELIKLDMAAWAEVGEVPKIERYTDAFPNLLPIASVPVDLVMEEIQLRKDSGVEPDAEEYGNRFAQFKSILAPLLGAAEVTSAPQARGVPTQLRVGSTIDDFLIIQTLGSGAFAFVYLARQISMQRIVALKVSKGTGDESQALAQLDHPNIVRVFDQRSVDDPAVHLLYMQYLPGGTLSDVVKLVRATDAPSRNGTLVLDAVDHHLLRAAQAVPERSAVREWLSSEAKDWASVVAWLGAQLARALDSAHENHVFHRDVKPANVLLTPEGIPKLADFNVSFAGAAGRAGAAATFGGSIGYMSPEHLQALNPANLDSPNNVTESADLYSLAILLWELWQGNRPFDCASEFSSWTDAIESQTTSRHAPLLEPERVGDATERVLEVTLREALNPEPEKRPINGAALAGRLKLALYPKAAKIFRPDSRSVCSRVLSAHKWMPWLVAALVIMIPNLAMTSVNYVFNMASMEEVAMRAGSTAAEVTSIKTMLAEYLHKLSRRVDMIVLPLGFLLVLSRIRPAAAAIARAEDGDSPTNDGIDAVLYLSQHVALLGALLWSLTGIFYSTVLWWKFEIFHFTDAIQFFMSLLICGGIAATYPFFGMALLATNVYYPRLIRESMVDAKFDIRHLKMMRRSEFWLWAGFGVPLLGTGLLITKIETRQGAQNFLSALVILTFLGFVAAFLAYTKVILRRWAEMSQVLSPNAKSTIPGIEKG